MRFNSTESLLKYLPHKQTCNKRESWNSFCFCQKFGQPVNFQEQTYLFVRFFRLHVDHLHFIPKQIGNTNDKWRRRRNKQLITTCEIISLGKMFWFYCLFVCFLFRDQSNSFADNSASFVLTEQRVSLWSVWLQTVKHIVNHRDWHTDPNVAQQFPPVNF